MRKTAVLVVALSITTVGAVLLSWQGATKAASPKIGIDVTVWMKPDANAQEIHEAGNRLSQLSYVRHPCAYWNKEQNFAEARKLLPSDVMRGVSASTMPTSFWCEPVTSADAEQVIHTMNGTPGVLRVTVGPNRSAPRTR